MGDYRAQNFVQFFTRRVIRSKSEQSELLDISQVESARRSSSCTLKDQYINL
jgi:hypothetical protein